MHRLQHGLQERQAQVHGHARVRRRAPTAPRCPPRSRSRDEGLLQEVGLRARDTAEVLDGPASGGAVVVHDRCLDSSAVLTVFAHGIVGRADLPIPEALFGVAAAAVLVLVLRRARAAVVAAAAAGATRSGGCSALPARGRRRARRRSASLVLRPHRLRRPRGHGRSSATTSRRRWSTSPSGSACRSRRCSLGDVWRLLSPWRALGRGAGWLAQRVGGEELPEPMAYPARLGRWPAAAGLLALRRSASCAGRRRATRARSRC